jgi:hypothetical protein
VYTVPTYSQLLNTSTYQQSYQQLLGQLRGEIDQNKALESRAQTNELNAKNQLGSSYEASQRSVLDNKYNAYYANADADAQKHGLNTAINSLPTVVQPYVKNYQTTVTRSSIPSGEVTNYGSNNNNSGQSINSLLNYITLGNVTRNSNTASLGSRYWF